MLMGGRLDKGQQEEANIDVCSRLEETHKYDVFGQDPLQYLEISEAYNGESPRILTVLSSALLQDIERNEKELAKSIKDETIMGNTELNTLGDCKYDKKVEGENNGNGSNCKRRLGRGEHEGMKKEQRLRMFNGVRAPSIGVESYIARIHKYARCSPCCFVMAYAYMNTLISEERSVEGMGLLTSLNVHRLLITSIMLAAKFMDDRHYNNAYYAKIGGVSNAEINGLEMKFLKLVGYQLHIDAKEFQGLCLHLANVASMQISPMRQLMLSPPAPLLCGFENENGKHSTLVCTHFDGP